MSDPYNNQYGQQYNQYPPNQYGSPAPGQGYAPPQENYQQGYQQPGYPSYPPQQQQGGYGDQSQYNQHQPYGPPSQGGFQHGQSQAPVPYSDPYQQQQGQYNQPQYPGSAPAQQFPQQGAYQQNQYPHDAQAPYGQPAQQTYGPTDPNAQAEGDRGLMGALGGGAAGYFGGNKMGGHGIIGALAGAVLGSKLEDKHKNKKHGGY
ncbi:hypothetical protein K505DRAFT_331873 [Melanomma pulvis-pyrius CBS 109.77]|uniref:Glycine zipper 2TM domain-containing protein n=1 Tax=Melanomma pulvis-pyrius CBS 109.77 TaxID=1314802 RepID=A0A6A6XUR4_9PLEO|nr:hypothetical protein K505DRAFT_331873 [Melanomma pulvis-pyrius CBS 109.77]